MTSPRGTYGGGYYSSPAFPDTPIYDSLVAERGTPQIAPIRVPSAYEPSSSNLPALPALPPARPSAPPSSHTPPHGMQTGYLSSPQPSGYGQGAPLQNAPAPYIPQQTPPRNGHTGAYPTNGYGTNGAGYQTQQPYQNGASYDTGARPVPPRPAPPRPAPVRPAPAPAPPYGEQQYRRPHPGSQGY